MNKELFADVILPLALRNPFTYSVPEHLQQKINVGSRVVVEFKTSKLYTAIVYRIHENKPSEYKTKPIENVLDGMPIVNEIQLQFWKWMADYYLCTMGEVMNAAVPSGLKLTSETKIMLGQGKIENLSADELSLINILKKNHILSIDDATEILNKKAHSIIVSLLQKGIILVKEVLKEKYKPKIVPYVRFSDFANDEENLKEIYNELEKKSEKQLELVIAYVKLSERYSKKRKEVKKTELLEASGVSESVLNTLIKKKIFEIYRKEIGRFASENAYEHSKLLSAEQEKSLNQIKLEWETHKTVLFHGITSSGKTEIYVKLIEETLLKGKQVLYLIPEIALTTQVTERIKKYFGDKLGVYHSRFNENERVEIWNSILKSRFQVSNPKFQIILGARSALFLPFSNLGLIIVDEEHDGSYKQQNPAPRYNARDAAIVLAKMHNAKVILGSATPSIESYFNAQERKYGFAQLLTRHGGAKLPEIIISDIKQAAKLKQMKSHFSPILIEHIETALKAKEQVIIFQNRRGFAPYLECQACGWIPQCKNCDVSVVYHKTGSQLRCHYCGFTLPLPSLCKKCGDTKIKMKNFGTERIEEELEIFFPQARIARMDLDSTRIKFAYQRLINDFEERKIDILVGTQMVTKGLDFDNVGVVGIVNADQMLNFPDFRSHERSFQIMSQVAGRAGRKNKGKVIIQTYSPSHPVIKHVVEHDYTKMFSNEIEHRKKFKYPPFYRLIELTIMHREMNTVGSAADKLAQELKLFLGKRVLGPEFALIPRIKNLYHKKILLKISREESVSKVKEKLFELISQIQNNEAYKMIKIQADVDPA